VSQAELKRKQTEDKCSNLIKSEPT